MHSGLQQLWEVYLQACYSRLTQNLNEGYTVIVMRMGAIIVLIIICTDVNISVLYAIGLICLVVFSMKLGGAVYCTSHMYVGVVVDCPCSNAGCSNTEFSPTVK